jgi:hypothetical protein
MRRPLPPVRLRRAAAALPVGALILAVLPGCLPTDDPCPYDPITGGYTCTIDGGGDPAPDPIPNPGGGLGGTGGDPIPGGGGGGGAVPDGKGGLPAGAVSKVNEVLNGDCKSLLSPVSAPFLDPKAVWDAVPIQQSPTPKPGAPTATADAPVGVGSTGPITIYPAFYTAGPDSIFGFIPAHNGLTRLPTDDEMKAMTLLHEIGHLTGSLGNHDQAGSDLYNLLILEKCFGIQRIPV